MPIYEYACSDCGHHFETLVRSDTVPECPTCHSHALEKQLSVFATSSSDGASAAPLIPPSPCASCERAGSCMMQ